MIRVSRPVQVAAFLILALFGDLAFAQSKNSFVSSGDGNAGVTSLMSAVINKDSEGVKFFIKSDKSSINTRNIGGASALLIAAREDNFEIAKILIEAGADINSADNDGWTPLMRASLAGNPSLVKDLVAKGANAGQVNKFGELAIFHAAASNCNQCLAVLLEGYEFVQKVNSEILKSNLKDSFELAMNHGNEAGQSILSSYLDYAQKEWSEKHSTSQKIEMNAAKSAEIGDAKGVKKFRFIPNKKPESQANKQQYSEKDIALPSPTKPSLPFVKYRFKVGESAKVIENKSPEKSFSKPKKQAPEKSDLEKNALNSNQNSGVEMQSAKPDQSGFVGKFKFVAGPQGKKMKSLEPKLLNSKAKGDKVVDQKNEQISQEINQSQKSEIVDVDESKGDQQIQKSN